MAEAYAKQIWGARFSFFSAGTEIHGLNPRAMQVLREDGLNVDKASSKQLEDVTEPIHLIISVCSSAEAQCPATPGRKRLHYGFDDPPGITKDWDREEDVLAVYRRVRDEIKTWIKDLPQWLEAHNA